MNILILSDYYPPDKIGGVGEISKNLKRAYEHHGHNVYVLTTGVQTVGDKNNHVYRSLKNLTLGVFVNNIFALWFLRKHKIDIINLHQSSTTLFLLAKIFKPLCGFPKIVNSFQVLYISEFLEIRPVKIQGVIFRPKFYEYIEKYIAAPVHILIDFVGYLFTDVVTVVSHAGKKEMELTFGKLMPKPIHIIPNGVNPSDFDPSKAQNNLEIKSQIEGCKVIMYTGVFRTRKRLFNLIFILKEILQKNNNVKLVFVGGGRGLEEPLSRLAQEIQVDSHVIFCGKVPNAKIPHYLALADIFCLPSSYEGMPVALLEAMSMGKAVLSTRTSGMIDLIEDRVTGRLVEVDNINKFANAALDLLSDKKSADIMGKQARKIINANYQWNNLAKSYIKLFN